MILVDLTSPQAAGARDLVAVLPVGSVEQHATHLPVGTDAVLAARVAAGVEAARPTTTLLMPPLWYGASDHHEGMPGTVSVGSDLVVGMIVAALSGLHRSTGVMRALVVNGHGGNEPAMRVALERLARSAPAVRAWAVSYWEAMFAGLAAAGQAAGPMGHADRHETSLVMHVRTDLGIDDAARPDRLLDGLPGWVHTAEGFHVRTRAGGVGNPGGASAAEGERFLTAAVEGLCGLVDRLAVGTGA